MSKIFDVTIIGGSFSGMSAALALSNISDDLKIAVIERLMLTVNKELKELFEYKLTENIK